jgi:predicted histidine transporter YuiF (NhaC family)
LAGNYNVNVNYGTLTVTAAEVIEEPEPPLARPAEEIDDGETPLAGANAWALINLISMILTVGISLGMIITYFKKKKNEEEDEKTGETKRELTEEEEEKNERRKGKFLGLIPGIGSVVAFFLTEDLTAPNMVLTDRWTVLMLAILVIGAALAYLTRNEKDKEDEEKPEQA